MKNSNGQKFEEIKYDAIVIGAGLAGLGVARGLVLQKKKVLVVEKLVRGASTIHASGILDPFVDLDYRPEILALTVPAVKDYPRWIKQMEKDTGLTGGYDRFDLLYTAFTKEDEKKLRDFMNRPGVRARAKVQWASPAVLAKVQPGLSPDLRGGLLFKGCARVIPELMLKLLKRWLQLRGVHFMVAKLTPELLSQKGHTVGIRLGSRIISAENVVGCIGAWAGNVDIRSGLRRPVEPVRGQVLIYNRKKPLKALLHTADGGYLVPWSKGKVLAGSTVEPGHYQPIGNRSGRDQIRRYAECLLPELAGKKPVGEWAGIRPRSINGRPAIGKTGLKGYYVAGGYYRCGILIGVHAGEMLGRLISTGKLAEELKPFSPIYKENK